MEGDFSLSGEPTDSLHHQVPRGFDLAGQLAKGHRAVLVQIAPHVARNSPHALHLVRKNLRSHVSVSSAQSAETPAPQVLSIRRKLPLVNRAALRPAYRMT